MGSPKSDVEQDFLLAFAHIPPSAIRIPPPSSTDDSSTGNPNPDVQDSHAQDTRLRSRLASFPPPPAVLAANNSKKTLQRDVGSNSLPTASSFTAGALSGGVADMFLSSILPSSLPNKSTSTNTHPGAPGRIRMLSSQREGLTLNNMTNNFRRFVSRAGFIFWLMDRVEEVMFWRKPVWTWAWIICWGFISFYPRLLLCIPSAALILILLHQYEKAHPSLTNPASQLTAVPASRSILSNPLAGTLGASLTANTDPAVNPAARNDAHGDHSTEGKAHGSTVDTDGNVIPAVSAGVPESGVDYYMNLQGIQNLMGLVSDVHDAVLPYLAMISPNLASTVPPPTTFPLSATHILMLLLPPTILLPLLPSSFIPYLLLPLGIAPPVIFHPAFLYTAVWTQGFLRPSRLKAWRAKAERWVLTDRLDDSIAQSEIREVRVWENERLDPNWRPENVKTASTADRDVIGAGGKVAEETTTLLVPPESAWSSRFLKSAERRPWVRVLPRDPTHSLWSEALPNLPASQSTSPTMTTTTTNDHHNQSSDGRVALSLIPGWSFVPREEWRVDLAANWSTSDCDEAGWVYCDDHWEHAAARPLVVPVPGNAGKGVGAGGAGKAEAGGGVPIYVTRRRQWWRRVYSTAP
ncbi:hypothetical protein QFC21_004623 [Naganishia friedmannii]|uniref:Uncharacterized protein n=1 Tax=Naganishia friedmannii TaxID=89922 RepID=A0ACC2VF41_9TREE|nr:hypothetical protein QFC21_004623 [Naganishia friedmannii]